ncbi:LysR family transcriptional regulator [Duganella sp. FT92W]|uniref:LysR family transcriptional regulator n=1 Tax=Pseudoduganella rivuli TaxID=2666085 RepID=A0A7X2LUT4_9BURK|nr:LysR family transcriptional regulator [Pseudoduganella rivuli]MRV73229.1 LysR family transcriptional regulator [Pseudoduganella rivuli]
MNLTDLRIFVSAARQPTLADVAQETHLTPSAVSKALRRLEDSLGKPLFDRSARQLVLNASGALLLPRAQALLALAEQAKADVQGEDAVIDCRIAGPAILLWRYGEVVAGALRLYPDASLRMLAMFEDNALAALARGDAQAAIVTGEVLDGKGAHWSAAWETVPLGVLAQYLVAGRTHPLAAALAPSAPAVESAAAPALQATAAQVLEHEFACPSHSLFCGERRGPRSDGWRDDQLPRKIRYWTDDLQLLLAFVKSGAALAYLPDFALDDPALVRIDVPDAAFTCHEQVALVYDVGRAPAWLLQLASQCGASPHA